jgi:hypothetical protein
VTDFDYGFKPRVHDRLVRDLKETCSHPLGGVEPHTAKLIQDLASSHPNYDANQHVADRTMLDWSHAASPVAALPGSRDPNNSMRVLAGTAPPEPEPQADALVVGRDVHAEADRWARELLSSPSSPELRRRSGLALQAEDSSEGVSDRMDRWKETTAAERYDRQTICASWSQAQLHAYGASACFGPAAMGLSGKARQQRKQQGRGGRSSGHRTPTSRRHSRPSHSRASSRSRSATPEPAPTVEQLVADEQASYGAWFSSDLARPGYRPNLAMQKHQLQLEQWNEMQRALAVISPDVYAGHEAALDLDPALDPAVEQADISAQAIAEWDERSRRQETEHLAQLGWPNQPGTAEYKAQELKLFSDRQQRKVRHGCYRCPPARPPARPPAYPLQPSCTYVTMMMMLVACRRSGR